MKVAKKHKVKRNGHDRHVAQQGLRPIISRNFTIAAYLSRSSVDRLFESGEHAWKNDKTIVTWRNKTVRLVERTKSRNTAQRSNNILDSLENQLALIRNG